MKRSIYTFLTALLLCVPLSSCGYHLGGVKPAALREMHSFSVDMFRNMSTQPQVSMQLTSALTNAMQGDGTYRLAPRNKADFIISGDVVAITPRSLTTDWRDSYLSSEIGLTLTVRYTVTERMTGKTLASGTVEAESSYYNQDDINIQNTRTNALSYAARLAADEITARLTSP